jgi:hypothetical protein
MAWNDPPNGRYKIYNVSCNVGSPGMFSTLILIYDNHLLDDLDDDDDDDDDIVSTVETVIALETVFIFNASQFANLYHAVPNTGKRRE